MLLQNTTSATPVLPRPRQGQDVPAEVPDRPDRSVWGLVFFGVVAFAAVSPVVRHAMWPVNYDNGRMFGRTAVYAAHMRHGDFFPMWSDSDAYGFGTPLPLFYQKLFFWVSGSFAIIGFNVKAAVVAALFVFTMAGLLGMRQVFRELGAGPVVSVLGAAPLALSAQGYSEWIGRGALSEYSAMMVLPWVIAWCVRLIRTAEFRMRIVPIFVLLLLAHNVIALFSVPLLGVAAIVAVVRHGLPRTLLRPAAKAVGLTALCLAPLFLLLHLFEKDYDTSQILPWNMRPAVNFRPLTQYLHNPNYELHDGKFHETLGIDRPLLWALAALALIRPVVFVYRRWFQGIREALLAPAELFLVGCLLTYTVLMLKVAAPVYRLPMLVYIQLPFRLLTFVTPLLIVVVVALAMRSLPPVVPGPAALVLLAAMIGATPLVRQVNGGVDPAANSEAAFQAQGSSAGDTLLSVGEYLPMVFGPDGERVPTDTVMSTYQRLSEQGFSVVAGKCTGGERPRGFESDTRRFQVNCTGPAVLALPISYNSWTQVRFGGHDVPVSRQADDPRIIVTLPHGGAGELTAQLPTVWRMLRRLI